MKGRFRTNSLDTHSLLWSVKWLVSLSMVDGRLGILLVEDERQLSRAISRTLRGYGFDVVAAPTAAMARVLECRFRLGIFDIDLGDGCGIELARELLNAESVQCAVFFSATSDASALARAAQVGPVISKGEGIEALLPVLSQAIPQHLPRESGIVPCLDVECVPGPDVLPDPGSLLAGGRRVS
jgi:CheY-like chemotaxis protein